MITITQAKSLLDAAEPHALNPHISKAPITPNHLRVRDDRLDDLGIKPHLLDDCSFYDGAEHVEIGGRSILVHVLLKDRLERYTGSWQDREAAKEAALNGMQRGG